MQTLDREYIEAGIYLADGGKIYFRPEYVNDETMIQIHPFIEDNIINDETIDWPGVWADVEKADAAK